MSLSVDTELAAIPIILISALGEMEAPTPPGTVGRLQKPLSLDQLAKSVQSVLASAA